MGFCIFLFGGIRFLYKVMFKCSKILINSWYDLGIPIQLRNLFEPMYAQRDFMGVAISFVMRIILVIFKLVSFVMVFGVCMILFILWVSLPIICIYGIVSNYKFLIRA